MSITQSLGKRAFSDSLLVRPLINCPFDYLASFIFALHLAEKWQRHPAADLRGYKPLLQFTIFSSNKSVKNQTKGSVYKA
ncbi:MAG: hypothetical protein B1H11_03010 [Desulfobacteraceae bacterium 4484_190.1]|nr:MAG: hypothetical protein B1H11_03010 [Desulfobacteraceae bacterium 4484_190.1]